MNYPPPAHCSLSECDRITSTHLLGTPRHTLLSCVQRFCLSESLQVLPNRSLRIRLLLPILVLFCCATGGIVAQQPSSGFYCDCSMWPGMWQGVINTTICVDGDTLDVQIHYCHHVANPPAEDICDPNDLVDAFTNFKKVCGVNGSVLPPGKAQQIMAAVYYALDPFGGDILNQRASIPYCDQPPNRYCWHVNTPRCVRYVGNCLENCANSTDECCMDSWAMCVDRATGMPLLERRDAGGCAHPTVTCNLSCITIDCGFVPGELDFCN